MAGRLFWRQRAELSLNNPGLGQGTYTPTTLNSPDQAPPVTNNAFR